MKRIVSVNIHSCNNQVSLLDSRSSVFVYTPEWRRAACLLSIVKAQSQTHGLLSVIYTPGWRKALSLCELSFFHSQGSVPNPQYNASYVLLRWVFFFSSLTPMCNLLFQQWNLMKYKKNWVWQESEIGTGMCSHHAQQLAMVSIKDYNG